MFQLWNLKFFWKIYPLSDSLKENKLNLPLIFRFKKLTYPANCNETAKYLKNAYIAHTKTNAYIAHAKIAHEKKKKKTNKQNLLNMKAEIKEKLIFESLYPLEFEQIT